MMRSKLPHWKKGQCLIYGRCSKDTQDTSLADQYRIIEDFSREAGLSSICAPFEDDGGRGHDEEREGLQGVLDYVRTHPNRVRDNEDFIPVLVYCVARFGRFDDPKKFVWYATEIEKSGYEFYSVQEGVRSRGDLTDFIQLILKGQQAYEFTVDLSAYGIRTGCSLATKGWWPGGNPPYGFDRLTYGLDGKPRYRYVSRSDKAVEKVALDGTLIETFMPIDDKGKLRSAYSDKLRSDKVKLVPNDGHGKVVARIFDWFVTEDWGLKRIAAKLNHSGVPAPRGRHWLKGSVRGILKNPAYKGALVYGRRSDGKHHDVSFEKSGTGYIPRVKRRDIARYEIVKRPLEECVVVEDCHKAIVSPELWNAAHEKLARRKAGKLGIRGKGARGSGYLLTGDGLMKCVHCGYHYHGSTDRTSKIRYYLDGGYHAGGKDVCRMTLVAADDLERMVLEAIETMAFGGDRGLFSDERDLTEAIEQELATSDRWAERSDPQADALQKKLAAVRKKREDAERFEKEFGAAASDLVRRIKEEEDALVRECFAQRPSTPQPLSALDRRRMAGEIARYKLSLKEVFAHGTPDERKRFIRDFVASIEVDGRERKVRIGFYGEGGNSTLRVVPPTGFEPVSRT